MILLTVGYELPFNRLVRAVDEWCASRGRTDVFGQIADPGPSGHRPRHFEWQSFLEPEEFQRRFEQADLVVGHAGMGSIVTALCLAKPIVIMPRRAALKETRNDHQVATAEKFALRPGVRVAADETEVGPALDGMVAGSAGLVPAGISKFAAPRLLDAIRSFIHEPDKRHLAN